MSILEKTIVRVVVAPAIATAACFWIANTYDVGAQTHRPATTETATAATPAPTSMELARSYAASHGLTSCTTPDRAELDDVFLAQPADEQGRATSDRITPVDLDTALESAGERVILLACKD